MSTTSGTSSPDGPRPALVQAEAASERWADVARLQRWATPDHADFYGLAAEMVATLHALDDVAQVLRRQVAGYAQGRTLYDDTRAVDPQARLSEAAVELGRLIEYVQAAQSPANRFWSAVGHIGVEVTP